MNPYIRLYTNGNANRTYKSELYEIIKPLMEKYNLSEDYRKPMETKILQQEAKLPKPKQLKLTDFSGEDD